MAELEDCGGIGEEWDDTNGDSSMGANSTCNLMTSKSLGFRILSLDVVAKQSRKKIPKPNAL